jgi:hypothetical protein
VTVNSVLKIEKIIRNLDFSNGVFPLAKKANAGNFFLCSISFNQLKKYLDVIRKFIAISGLYQIPIPKMAGTPNRKFPEKICLVL